MKNKKVKLMAMALAVVLMIGAAAQAETLGAKILQKQSTDLDAVTGATLSSIGLLDAVDAALSQAVK